MSSMFKKKGAIGFKPKAPSARPRTSVSGPSTAAGPPKPASTQPTIDEPVVQESEKTRASSKKGPAPQEKRRRPSRAAAESEASVAETTQPALTQSKPTTRRASRSQHTESTSRPQIIPDRSTVASQSAIEIDDSQPPPAPRTRTRSQSVSKATPTQPTERRASKSRSTPVVAGNSSIRQDAAIATTIEDVAVVDEAAEESTRPKKRQRKTSGQDNDARPTRPRTRKTSTPNADGSRSSSRRLRSQTPEDAESQQVDLQKLRMADLTKDLRIGKKFSRHDELRDRERQARLKAKLEKDSDAGGSEAGGVRDAQSPSVAPKSGTPGAADASTMPAPAATSGPQFRIVDGQIVVDQSSLVMDRHARAAAAQAGEDMETIEENDFTRLITSSSFMNSSKLRGPNIWTDVETELFYRGLRMFGTEFEMISKMFPGKQRRHVKLKYNREERHNPERIDAAVKGIETLKMDIDEYQAVTGTTFESVETIEAEQRKIEEGYEAERQRIVDEQADIMRKKREELFADEDSAEPKKNGAKRGKKKGKQAVAYGLNGEPITDDT